MTRCFSFRTGQDPHAPDLWWLIFGLLLLMSLNLKAAEFPPKKYAVQCSAQVQESPAQIRLVWPGDTGVNSYEINRRTLESGWQNVAVIGGGETGWTDSNVQVGTPYEYQIIKRGSNFTGYGYIRAGIKVSLPDSRGKIVVLVENSIAGALGGELDQLKRDLIAEGWVVLAQAVSAGDSPQNVKNIIKNFYDADPQNVKALLLLGHVPVPYSGNIFPDGHANHKGAWPADTYYGDMDGNWTDSTVNTRTAERESNWNVPGDGKFDQSLVPSNLELMVGRVDLSNLTCFSNKNPSRSELDLMRQYLQKLHNFRAGLLNVNRKALICDNFSDKGDDPIAGSAWRAFPAFFGAGNITEAPWDGYLPAGASDSYLWSYGSGGGSYYYSTGVATSDDFALQDLKVVFTMFMGSYFGDWNNESNFLRAALGSGWVLTSSYSGFPHTMYFPMGLGETIGYCMRLSQNNHTNTLYAPWNQGTSQTHISLLGDPTLRMHPVKSPSNLNLATGPGTVNLSWSPSPDSNIQGYHVYRSASAEGPFARITGSPVAGVAYTDNPAAGTYTYMVKAIKLEQSGSGTYFNPSLGISAGATVTGSAPQVPTPPVLQAKVESETRIDLSWAVVGNANGYKLERKTGSAGQWSEIASVDGKTTAYSNQGLSPSTEYFYRLRAFNDAGSSQYSSEVRAVTSAPPVQPPAAPSLTATVVAYNRVDLAWNDLPNETGFKVERKTGSTGQWSEIASKNANETSFQNSGLTGSTEYFYRVRAFNEAGFSPYSTEVRVTTPAAPQAGATLTFVGTDRETQGNWPTKFGADGFSIAMMASQIAPGSQLALSGKSDFMWEPFTSDPRALLDGPNSSTRVASAWYGAEIVVDVTVSGSAAKPVSLYFLDWDNSSRVQKIEAVDVATGLVLDSREVGNFGNGAYLTYSMKGEVRFKVSKVSGPNALLNGVFFGNSVAGPISNKAVTLNLRRAAGNGLVIQLSGDTGQKFKVQSSPDFKTWSDIATGTISTGGTELPVSLEGNRGCVLFRAVNLP